MASPFAPGDWRCGAPFVQLNTPHTYRWLAFDVDRPDAAFAAEEANLAAPNVAVINVANRHAHLLYALADPVHATAAARRAPLAYLADYRARHGAQARGRPWLYRADCQESPLPALAHALGRALPVRPGAARCRPEPRGQAASARARRTDWARTQLLAVRRSASPGLSRRAQFKTRGLAESAFRSHLEHLAAELNQEFTHSPAGLLSRGDLRAIAKSIAKFCYRRMSPGRFSAIQRHRAEARTRRHMRVIETLKRGDGA